MTKKGASAGGSKGVILGVAGAVIALAGFLGWRALQPLPEVAPTAVVEQGGVAKQGGVVKQDRQQAADGAAQTPAVVKPVTVKPVVVKPVTVKPVTVKPVVVKPVVVKPVVVKPVVVKPVVVKPVVVKPVVVKPVVVKPVTVKPVVVKPVVVKPVVAKPVTVKPVVVKPADASNKGTQTGPAKANVAQEGAPSVVSGSVQPQGVNKAARAQAETSPPSARVPPAFDVVRVDAQGNALVAGTGEPGARISVFLDDTSVAQTNADSQGKFVAMFKVPTGDKPHVLSLSMDVKNGSVLASVETIALAPISPPPPVAPRVIAKASGAAAPAKPRVASQSAAQPQPQPGTSALTTRRVAPQEADKTSNKAAQVASSTASAKAITTATTPATTATTATTATATTATATTATASTVATATTAPAATPPMTVAQTAEAQTAAAQTAAAQTAAGQTAAGQTAGGQTAAGQTAAGQTAQGQTAQGQTAAGQTAAGQTAEAQTAAPSAATEARAPAILMVEKKGVKLLQPAGTGLDATKNVVIDVISYDDAGDVSLAGRGTAKDFVRIYLDNRPVGTARIGADGTWHSPLLNVASGIYALRVDQLDAHGKVTSRMETPFKRESKAVLARAAAQLAKQNGVLPQGGAALHTGAANQAATAVQARALQGASPAAGAPVTKETAPAQVAQMTSKSVPPVASSGALPAPRVAAISAPVPPQNPGSGVVPRQGVSAAGSVETGDQTGGGVAANAPVLARPTAVAGTAPKRAHLSVVTVQPGFTLWRIARENYGLGHLYVRVYNANRAQIRNPDLIYPGQVFTIPDGDTPPPQ